MFSRQSLGTPVLQMQPWRDRIWREGACQRTRRTRQLGENVSRGAVGAVSGKSVDAGHHGGEHRGAESRGRHHQPGIEDRPERTAGRAGAAFVLAGLAESRRRVSRGRRNFVDRGRTLVMCVLGRSTCCVVCVIGRPD